MAKNIPFPIKTETSCLLKWNWSSIWLPSGTTNSCHRNLRIPIPLEDFDNFHNLPYKIDHRESMLRGEWPNSPEHLGCGYCKAIEDNGGRSDRMFMSEKQDQTPDELENNPTATHVTPTVLEVFASDVCNLACTYCSIKNSSKIANEAKKYNMPEFDDFYFGSEHTKMNEDMYEKYFNKLVSWLERYGRSLRRFHILGGEPFYQKHTNDLLDIWKDNPNPNLQLNIVSNFCVKPDVFNEYIQKINLLIEQNKIERFDLTASVDCWGDSQEYVRYGFNIKTFEENMLTALKYKSVRINIQSTHSLMSIDDYPELLKKKSEWQKISGQNIALYGQLASGHHPGPTALGGEFFKKSIKNIREMHPSDTWDDKEAFRNINGLLKVIENSKPNMEKIKHFVKVYTELDRRHGTNWRLTFPRIAEEIDKHIVHYVV